MVQNSQKIAKATITDVARMAGVSIKTVSRVMNTPENVREATRNKVKEAAHLLSYEPNQSARMLAGNRSYSIGLAYENPREFSYLKHMLDGVFEAAGELGYSLLLKPCNLDTGDLKLQIKQFVTQTRIDGIILTPPLTDIEALTDFLQQDGIPFVQISPKHENESAIVIKNNELDACTAITEHIISLGHTRIGFVKGNPAHGAARLRFQGYVAALRRHKIAYDASLVRQGYFDFESGQRAANRLLDLPEPPTAIVSSNDDMAAGVMFVARERGLVIPDQLSVTGFDDTPTASHIWPPLTTIKQPITEMGAEAARHLISRIRGTTVVTKPLESLSCQVIIRHSTASPVS
jgi:LacI family transcriptional regulator